MFGLYATVTTDDSTEPVPVIVKRHRPIVHLSSFRRRTPSPSLVRKAPIHTLSISLLDHNYDRPVGPYPCGSKYHHRAGRERWPVRLQ